MNKNYIELNDITYKDNQEKYSTWFHKITKIDADLKQKLAVIKNEYTDLSKLLCDIESKISKLILEINNIKKVINSNNRKLKNLNIENNKRLDLSNSIYKKSNVNILSLDVLDSIQQNVMFGVKDYKKKRHELLLQNMQLEKNLYIKSRQLQKLEECFKMVKKDIDKNNNNRKKINKNITTNTKNYSNVTKAFNNCNSIYSLDSVNNKIMVKKKLLNPKIKKLKR